MNIVWGVIAAAVVGALLALSTRWVLRRLRAPKLEITFEELEGKKPYIHSFALAEARSTTKGVEQDRALFFRLVVRNRGGSPALNCQAKLTVSSGGKKEVEGALLHWSRLDPIVTGESDGRPQPVHIAPGESDVLDVFMLNYKTTNGEVIRTDNVFYSLSPQSYRFQPQLQYNVTVTVEAANTVSQPLSVRVLWYGTFEAFDDGRFVTGA